jgi:hypothetical protein
MKWLRNVEPTIDDVLSDAVVMQAMASYGTSPEKVRSLLEQVSRSQCAMSALGRIDGTAISALSIEGSNQAVEGAVSERSKSGESHGERELGLRPGTHIE